MIVGVAIRSEVVTIMLPKPNRHHHCFEYLRDRLGVSVNDTAIGRHALNQGFYTHTGRYLNREQALKYAKRLKQQLIGSPKHCLFSEDLW